MPFGRLALLILSVPLLMACDRPPVEYDLHGRSFELLDQDSSRVTFPGDFSEEIVVAGFIFTNCPDVCPLITANLANIRREMEDTSGVRFVAITFDPERDIPSVMKTYMRSYRLNGNAFTMLTGEPAEIDSLLSAVAFTARKTPPDSTHGGGYMMEHSNSIMVMDGNGRVRFEYPGSVVPPDYVIEDINRLR